MGALSRFPLRPRALTAAARLSGEGSDTRERSFSANLVTRRRLCLGPNLCMRSMAAARSASAELFKADCIAVKAPESGLTTNSPSRISISLSSEKPRLPTIVPGPNPRPRMLPCVDRKRKRTAKAVSTGLVDALYQLPLSACFRLRYSTPALYHFGPSFGSPFPS